MPGPASLPDETEVEYYVTVRSCCHDSILFTKLLLVITIKQFELSTLGNTNTMFCTFNNCNQQNENIKIFKSDISQYVSCLGRPANFLWGSKYLNKLPTLWPINIKISLLRNQIQNQKQRAANLWIDFTERHQQVMQNSANSFLRKMFDYVIQFLFTVH